MTNSLHPTAHTCSNRAVEGDREASRWARRGGRRSAEGGQAGGGSALLHTAMKKTMTSLLAPGYLEGSLTTLKGSISSLASASPILRLRPDTLIRRHTAFFNGTSVDSQNPDSEVFHSPRRPWILERSPSSRSGRSSCSCRSSDLTSPHSPCPSHRSSSISSAEQIENSICLYYSLKEDLTKPIDSSSAQVTSNLKTFIFKSVGNRAEAGPCTK